MTVARLEKMEIIKLLREKHRLGAFLEISTPTTGHYFAAMSDQRPETHRLVYNCPDHVDDGLPYTFRTSECSSHKLTQAILAANQSRPVYDLIFVDPFHTYACSSVDLSGAFALLRPGGIMVVHDCHPTDAELATPQFRAGSWCGLTYMAFIDFSLRRDDLCFYTVDTDFGCGIVHKHPARTQIARLEPDARDQLAFAWDVARHDEATRYNFFARHCRELLNLKSVEEFLTLEGLTRTA
jgi:hypothetical protein